MEAFDSKLKDIDTLTEKWLQNANIAEPAKDTIDALHLLYPHFKHDKSRRLKTEYSYDIRDNEHYRKIYKVEEWLN